MVIGKEGWTTTSTPTRWKRTEPNEIKTNQRVRAEKIGTHLQRQHKIYTKRSEQKVGGTAAREKAVKDVPGNFADGD